MASAREIARRPNCVAVRGDAWDVSRRMRAWILGLVVLSVGCFDPDRSELGDDDETDATGTTTGVMGTSSSTDPSMSSSMSSTIGMTTDASTTTNASTTTDATTDVSTTETTDVYTGTTDDTETTAETDDSDTGGSVENCNPLSQDCPDGEGCYPIDIDFVCAKDASGGSGAVYDPCEFVNACDPGLVCVVSNEIEACDNSEPACCQRFCDLEAMSTCAAGEACTPWYVDSAETPPGFENVGVCV